MAKPTILVSCATSIATSTMVATCIRDALNDRGYDINVTQCSFSEIDTKIGMLRPILLLVTGTTKPYDIPTIVATPILTGIGKQKVIDQVIEIVDKQING